MGAFYVSIIFLGILLIIGSLFFIVMDKVNGKDFFKEFDRKKEEMFNLIQDSEEMLQELNKMSDYVVTSISEKNQEFFEKYNKAQTDNEYYQSAEALNKGAGVYNQMLRHTPAVPVRVNPVPSVPVTKLPVPAMPVESEQVSQAEETSRTGEITNRKEVTRKKGRKAKEDIKSNEVIKPHKDMDSNEDTKLQEDINSNEDTKLQGDINSNKDIKLQEDMDSNEDTKLQGDINSNEDIKLREDINSNENISPKEDVKPQTDIKVNNDGNKSRLVLNNKRHEVLKMIEQGMTNDEIADSLKIGKGEINLIRGLSK